MHKSADAFYLSPLGHPHSPAAPALSMAVNGINYPLSNLGAAVILSCPVPNESKLMSNPVP